MATRLRPLILSPAHYFCIVATLLLLGGVLEIAFEHDIRQFYAEHVTLPPLAREFGFTCQEKPTGRGYVLTSVAAGGAFDRVGIRAGDTLYTDLDLFLYALGEAHRGTRAQLMVIGTNDDGAFGFRCPWIDRNDRPTNQAKRPDAFCGDADRFRFERWALDWYAQNRPWPQW